ncbi:MBOAT family O-acyltransferase [Ponticaulis profundi]|uniref:Probable alginate O-acetylase AlgI n=1 Tax=Ponticaulis profundi TaxID=2665222 RepID=A0ABW1SAA6_9PROT
MIFTEAIFPLFLGIVLFVYWVVLRGDWRNHWLLLASAVFYGWWDAKLLLLIGAVIGVSWLAALMIRRREGDRRGQLIALWLAIGFQLSMLGVFKYFNFFKASAEDMLTMAGWTVSWPVLNIILPVGISFYIFQAISYLVDVFRKDLPAQRRLDRVALYIAFFPQLVAGPIVRAASFFPQIERQKKLTSALIASGAKAFIIGFIYKAALADNIAPFVDPVFAEIGLWSNSSLVAATLAFGTQIYFDFAGYSLMAIGVARWFGFYIPKNFDDPYSSPSMTVFWRRWHMSLSFWLRDYLYIPLGGNRLGALKTYRNLMITMVLGGLWHGAAWNFVIWGAIHGAALSLHRIIMGRAQNRLLVPALGGAFGIVMTLIVVFAAWVPFRAENLSDTVSVWAASLGLREGGMQQISIVAFFVPGLLLVDSLMSQVDRLKSLPKAPAFRSPSLYWAGLGCLTAIALALFPLKSAPFVYFQF